MANASMKWNEHVSAIMKGVMGDQSALEKIEDEEELAERGADEEDEM